MRKKVLSLFTFILVLLLAAAPCSTAFAAEYQPTEKIYAENYMLVSLDDPSYPVICAKNADDKVYPASLTKIVTAMVVLDNVENLDSETTVSQTAFNSILGTGAQTANLQVGDHLSVRQLLYLTMVQSACDACQVLAEYVAGGFDEFVAMMNEWAAAAGCTNTHFTNASGLHDENHYTTVNDLRLITLKALENKTFKKIAETKTYTYAGQTFYHSNQMLHASYLSYYYEYAKGIKTGSTSEAGYCVITTASKDGYNYLAIVCNSPRIDYNNDGYIEKCSFIDAATLFKWAFSSLSYKTVIKQGDFVCDVPVKNGKGVDTLQLVAKENKSATVLASLDPSMVMIRPTDATVSEAVAPVQQGDVLGAAEIIYGDQVVATVDLVAAQTVEVSRLLQIVNGLRDLLSNPIAIVVLVVIILAVIGLVVYTVLYNMRKRKTNALRRSYRDEEE